MRVQTVKTQAVDNKKLIKKGKNMNEQIGKINYYDIEAEIQQECERDFLMAAQGMNVLREQGVEAASMYLNYSARVFSYMLSIDENRFIPPEVKRKLGIRHYTCGGNYFKNICSVVRKSLKFRPEDWDKDMPEAVKGQDYFTVYRAGIEDISEAAEHISWTISKDVAMWFAEKYIHEGCEDLHVYKGIIPAKKVIAYLNDRWEFEIVQCKSVENIVEIPFERPAEEFMEIKKETRFTFDRSRIQAYVNAQLMANKSAS